MTLYIEDVNILPRTIISYPVVIDEYFVYCSINKARLYYPNFDLWYFMNVIPSTKNGSKKILTLKINDSFRGVSIIKYSEKKICNLTVADAYKNVGYGIKLFKKSFIELGTDKPFLTVSEEKLPEFKRLFKYFDFKLTDVKENYYRLGKKEYFFNQN